MSDLATIRAAIKAKLESVPGIGIVHDYVRYDQSSQQKFRELFIKEDVLHGWTIHRYQSLEREGATSYTDRIHRFEIRGYHQLEDSTKTEITFDNLIEDICKAFRMDEDLGCKVDSMSVDNIYGIQLEESDWVMFAGVLCHGVRLTLSVATTEISGVLEDKGFKKASIGIDLIGSEQSPDLAGLHILEVSQ